VQIPFAAVRIYLSGLGRLESDSLTRYRTSDIVLIHESLVSCDRVEIQNPVTPLYVWTEPRVATCYAFFFFLK